MSTNPIETLTVRGYLTSSNGKKQLRELQVTSQTGEVLPNMEHVEPYGFTSEPIVSPATDAFCIFFDSDKSHGVVISFCDRQFRLKELKPGEVALYDDQGQKIHLTRDGIEVFTSKNLKASVGGTTTLNSSGNVDVTAPLTNIHGDLTVNGTVSATGDVSAGGISLRDHVHTGDSGGQTSTPH